MLIGDPSNEGVEIPKARSPMQSGAEDKVVAEATETPSSSGENLQVPSSCERKSLGDDRIVELKRRLEEAKNRHMEKRKKKEHREAVAVAEVGLSEEEEEVSECTSITRSAQTSDSEEDDNGAPPQALEIFCGKAVLTSELQKAGFEATGVDYRNNKDRPVAKVVWLDLTVRDDQMQFWDWIRTGRVRYVHFAPPCGTASRAREIRRKGCDPKPLRTDEYPDGIPGLINRIECGKGEGVQHIVCFHG